MVVETWFVGGKTPLVLECMVNIKTFFLYDQNRHCIVRSFFLKRTSPKPSGTNLKGCKGRGPSSCSLWIQPPLQSLPRPVVKVTQTRHRGGNDTETAVRIFITLSPIPQTRTQSLFCIRTVMNGRDLVRTRRIKRKSNSPNFVPILERGPSLLNSQTPLRASNFPSLYCFARTSNWPLGTSLAVPCSFKAGRILVPGRGTFLAHGSAANPR